MAKLQQGLTSPPIQRPVRFPRFAVRLARGLGPSPSDQTAQHATDEDRLNMDMRTPDASDVALAPPKDPEPEKAMHRKPHSERAPAFIVAAVAAFVVCLPF